MRKAWLERGGWFARRVGMLWMRNTHARSVLRLGSEELKAKHDLDGAGIAAGEDRTGKEKEQMLEQKRLGNEGMGTARSEPASQSSDEMDQKDDQIAHHRIVAGR
jgi:hypothetical protein